MRRLKIAFLGVAHFHSENYAESLRKIPTVEATGVYEPNRNLGRRFGKKYGLKYFDDIDVLLRDENLDAVIITSETCRHHDLLLRAAESGKHVLCEKPLAMTLKETDDMRRAAERARIRLQMCHVMRHHGSALLVQKYLEEGRLGEVRAIVGTNKINASLVFRRAWFTDPKLAGGGAVMDHTVHLADLMRWYAKSEAVEVYTQIGTNILKGLRVEDNFLTTITFSNGAIGHVDGSWSDAVGFYTWGDVTLEIVGSKGAITLDAFRQNISFCGMRPPTGKLSWQYFGSDADTEMIRNFANSILNDEKPASSWEDGRRSLEITLASYESARKGKPVKLPL